MRVGALEVFGLSLVHLVFLGEFVVGSTLHVHFVLFSTRLC
jgi:hypothetical protein